MTARSIRADGAQHPPAYSPDRPCARRCSGNQPSTGHLRRASRRGTCHAAGRSRARRRGLREELVEAGRGTGLVELEAVAAIAEDPPLHDPDTLGGHVREVGIDLPVGRGVARAGVPPAAGTEVLARLPGVVHARPEVRLSGDRQPVGSGGCRNGRDKGIATARTPGWAGGASRTIRHQALRS